MNNRSFHFRVTENVVPFSNVDTCLSKPHKSEKNSEKMLLFFVGLSESVHQTTQFWKSPIWDVTKGTPTDA